MPVYLDNSATTKPCPEAVLAVQDALLSNWGNPSSLHSGGIEAHRLLRRARQSVAQALGATPEQVVFTSGGTEADNWAIFAAAERLGKRGRHIITTAVEHSAVLQPMKKLQERGFEVTFLPPDAQGCITTAQLENTLRPDTVFVSIMLVNNETGAVMPITQMAQLTHRRCPDALFHTDAVQGFMKIPFRLNTLEADLISVSAHKIHGPKGVGALVLRKGLPAYLLGGGQENGLRSGTEPLPAIAGFGAACEAALPTLREDIARQRTLLEQCRAGLCAIPGVLPLGAAQAPHILSLSVPGLRSQGLINCLQDAGVLVSAGSACAKGHQSHVLRAMGLDSAVIDGAIRVSLCRETTAADITQFLSALNAAISRLRR